MKLVGDYFLDQGSRYIGVHEGLAYGRGEEVGCGTRCPNDCSYRAPTCNPSSLTLDQEGILVQQQRAAGCERWDQGNLVPESDARREEMNVCMCSRIIHKRVLM